MAIVSAVTNFVVGFILIQTCLVVWIAVMFPSQVQRARWSIERAPAFTFGIGLTILLAALCFSGGLLLLRLPCIAAASQGLSYISMSLSVNRFSNDAYIIVHGVGWMLFAPFFMGWVVGQAAIAETVSMRIQQKPRLSHGSFSGLVAGAFCTSAAAFLPVIGWFCFFPVVSIMSLGAGICALLTIQTKDVVSAATRETELDFDRTPSPQVASLN